MANRNTHHCRICGREYEYCHSCSLTKNLFKNAGYCGENCYNISMLIQSYRSNVTSVEDAAQKLKEYGAYTMDIVPDVKVYVDEINNKATPKVEIQKIETTVVDKPKIEVVNKDKDYYFNKYNKSKYQKESLPVEEDASSFITDKDTKLLDE